MDLSPYRVSCRPAASLSVQAERGAVDAFMRWDRPWSAALGALLLVGLLVPGMALGADEDDLPDDREVIDLSPEEAPSLGVGHVSSGFGALFKGASHYYKQHYIDIETTPSPAFLDLFYVRSNFQKRYEQAESPVRVLLPARVNSGKRDSVTIRAFADGYRQKRVVVKADTTEKSLVIHLDPLPNRLEALGHQYFAGRTSITFLTNESLTFRLQEADDGLSVILTETAISPDADAALEQAKSPLIEEAYAQQLGEDLLVKLTFAGGQGKDDVEVRSRNAVDAARDLHVFTVDLSPKGGKGDAVVKAQAALKKIGRKDVSGCSLEFDRALREQMDAGALSRALAPSGSFTDPYLRAAMRRLGEVSPGGEVVLVDGSRFKPKVGIELEAALIQAASVKGYLAFLRSFANRVEAGAYRSETLRSLIAPELDSTDFDAKLEVATASERACRSGS